nr:MAG: hypothetical protein DIU70_11245 [Bacillota bacterium]
MPDYQVHLDAKVDRFVTEDDLIDFCTALEERPGISAPVAGGGGESLGATVAVEAPDAWEAVTRAVAEFRAALKEIGMHGRIVEIEVKDYDDFEVTVGEIARDLGVSRERVRRWIRNPEYGFPSPVREEGSQKLWRWGDVRRWAEERGVLKK